jgi:multimeric flavodoxin WrbA
MKRILVVYHSMTGAAEQLARAATDGAAEEPEIEARLLHAGQASGEDVIAADAFLFATPENLASMAGLMKDFFDRIYYVALDQVNGRPYAALIAAGTDGSGAARQIQRIATGLRLKEVAPPLIVRNGAQTPEAILAMKVVPASELAKAREVGAAMAAGLAGGIF